MFVQMFERRSSNQVVKSRLQTRFFALVIAQVLGLMLQRSQKTLTVVTPRSFCRGVFKKGRMKCDGTHELQFLASQKNMDLMKNSIHMIPLQNPMSSLDMALAFMISHGGIFGRTPGPHIP